MESRTLQPVSYHLKLPVAYKLPLIPGLKTSAAFLTSLSANLRLPDDDLVSSSPTTIAPFHPLGRLPDDVAFISSFLPSDSFPVSPSSVSSGGLSPTSSISGDPSPRRHRRTRSASTAHSRRNSVGNFTALWHTFKKSTAVAVAGPVHPLRATVTTPYIPTASTDISAALTLLSTTILTQRSAAARLLLLHPLNLTTFSLSLFLLLRILHTLACPPVAVVWTALVAAATAAGTAWLLTRGYAVAARRFRKDADGWLGDDVLFVSRNVWGQVVGAAVVRWVSDAGPGAAGHSRARSCSSVASSVGGKGGGGRRRRRTGRGEVRAWAVAEGWRGRGIGRELLGAVAEWVEGNGGVGVEFAEEHFASQRVLPPYYDKPFERRDRRAEATLRRVVDDGAYFSRRKSFAR